MNPFLIECPHCKEPVWIEQINCKIFRHAILKSNFTQIHPHATKEECEYYLQNDLVYGCAKPFLLIILEERVHPPSGNGFQKKYKAVECDYI